MKKKFLITICLSTILLCSGCGKLSFSDAIFSSGEDEIVGTLTTSEWTIKAKRETTTLITTGGALLSGSRSILEGAISCNEEIVNVENAIKEANDSYTILDTLAEPKDKSIEKQQTLSAITTYKDALLAYQTALESGDETTITTAIDRVNSSITNLVNYSGESN